MYSEFPAGSSIYSFVEEKRLQPERIRHLKLKYRLRNPLRKNVCRWVDNQQCEGCRREGRLNNWH